MTARDRPGRVLGGRHRIVPAAVAVLLLVLGACTLAVGLSRQEPAPPAAARPAPTSTATTAPVTSSPASPPAEGDTAPTLPRSAPTRLSVPAIGVNTSLERLGLDRHRALETPKDPAKAGWFTSGPTPGEQGPAVIAGHVTWNGARSVFFRLGSLRPGDRLSVRREDGSTARFSVTRTEQYPKDRFPSVEVYRNLDHAGLRLITCAGTYRDHRYSDNIVVYARLDQPGRS
ncbi:class F sortase [Streptomyces sp. SID5785]|uniref:class F sortase n=1 Tax=Streptomyces sp. SID5785 TaxID=2690309 RepID=UPI00136118F3|nr:class F sortase [Streptomyces sp. SID5785]MZD04640.1 class F sortase [Streptomyces sp. SID5785]